MKTQIFAALGIVTAAVLLRAASAFDSASLDCRSSAAPVKDELIAHEWGTFTSVQGADGVQMEWNPFTVSELPGFVYDRSRPNAFGRAAAGPFSGAKTAFRMLQRMETPVIYFYSDSERTVDVAVKFPQGIVTEWFPQVSAYGPYFGNVPAGSPLVKESLARWDKVKILPTANESLGASLPMDKSGSHYYAARDTDAAYLQVTSPLSEGRQPETDKFLFYRGVGNFTAPLQASLPGNGEQFLQLQNNGTEELPALFVLHVKGDQARLLVGEKLAPKQSRTMKLEPDKNWRPLQDVTAEISRRMESTLVAEGLYPREAAAMVATWRDSWFEEPGLRVLYTLPRAWTDGILPLDIKPRPEKVERVFVGRAELVTPSDEFALLKQVIRYGDAEGSARDKVVEQTRQLGFGRFAEPTMRRLMTANANRELSTLAWELLSAAYRTGRPEQAFAPLTAPANSVASTSPYE